MTIKPRANTPLKDALERSGMRHRWIAEQMGLDQPDFSKLVNGHRPPTGNEAIALSLMLRVPVGELFPKSEAVA